MTEENENSYRIGVGIVGSGMVTRSIHLPALAALSDRFQVRAIWDIDPELAKATAQTCGASAPAKLDELLGGPGMDVVVICSPAAFHAEQAIAALRAGTKVVLVEKPLCTSLEEAEAIAQAARETGGTVVVGAMHLFDPAWQFMAEQVAKQDTPAGLIRSCIILPPNARFDSWASETIGTPAPRQPVQRTLAMMMRISMLELAIHDLPLVRRLLREDTPEVLYAKRLTPFGYMVTIRAGQQTVDLFAFMHGHWRPEWTLTATAHDWHATAEFTPSFVMAGSGSASMATSGTSLSMSPKSHNGYAGEWLAIDGVLRGELPHPNPDDFVKDFAFALSIAEQASALIAAGEAQ
ncbi:Gfo/Idh/MocA family oxidoreductase [Sphingobium sp. H39-3-25]|uniref:Gfo/Idh/MocA family protein n=1 Tax=Sphingobium arseniciresistens TaxID=3030834 RepID=UPI0023BA2F98|nr:Gfo/Idh/MocA family oxidoreductase [Sphingobium arseniciresistens]